MEKIVKVRVHPIVAVLLVAAAHAATTVWVAFDNFMQMEESGIASISRGSQWLEAALAFPAFHILSPAAFSPIAGGGGTLVAALALNGLIWGAALVGAWTLIRHGARGSRIAPR